MDSLKIGNDASTAVISGDDPVIDITSPESVEFYNRTIKGLVGLLKTDDRSCEYLGRVLHAMQALGLEDLSPSDLIESGLYAQAILRRVYGNPVKAPIKGANLFAVSTIMSAHGLLSSASGVDVRLLGASVAVELSQICLSEKRADTSELGYVHPLFEKVYRFFWPEAERLAPHPGPEHRCDFLLSIEGDLAPVEIKKGAFNTRALVQLKSYMEVYDCRRGIAVGERLTVTLPTGVDFISISQMQDTLQREHEA